MDYHDSKIWILLKTTFEENDYLWCQSLGVDVNIETNMIDFTVVGTLPNFAIVGKRTIKLQSFTEKQESALILKYGTDLKFISSSKMIPLGEIK